MFARHHGQADTRDAFRESGSSAAVSARIAYGCRANAPHVAPAQTFSLMLRVASSAGLTAVRQGARWFAGLIAVLVAGVTVLSLLGFAPYVLSATEVLWLTLFVIAGAVVAVTLGGPWIWPGIIAASLLVGFISQLVFTEPRGFQAIDVQARLTIEKLAILAIVAQSLAAIIFFLSGTRFAKVARQIRTFGFWRLALALALTMLVSLSIMQYVRDWDLVALGIHALYAVGFLLLNCVSLLALCLSTPASSLDTIAGPIGRNLSLPGAPEGTRRLDKYVPLVAALSVFVLSVLLSFFAFERLPHVEDEVAYIFQARYFAMGDLAIDAPPFREAVDYYLLNFQGDQWFATTPPGWALVLSLGALVHLEWLVNPVLAAASVLLAHALIRREWGRGDANLGVTLMAFSPWFVAMSATFMNHTLTVALLLGSWLSLSRSRETGSVWWALLAGALMGLLFLTRPLDGLIVGVLTGLWLLAGAVRRDGWASVVTYGIGCLVIGGFVFPYNMVLTGNALATPLNLYIDALWYPGANRFGFGSDIGPPDLWGTVDLYRGHNILEAGVTTQHNGYMLNYELFGWTIGSLWLVLVHVMWGKWTRKDISMFVIVLAVISIYALYWFSGGFYIGPRYWFITFIPLVILSVRGLAAARARLAAVDRGSSAGSRLGVVVVALVVISVVAFLPWRGAARYWELRGAHSDYRDLLGANDLDGTLVFVSDTNDADFGSAFFLNSPDLALSPTIFVRDMGGEKNQTVIDAFPTRQVYYAQGRPGTGTKVTIRPTSDQ